MRADQSTPVVGSTIKVAAPGAATVLPPHPLVRPAKQQNRVANRDHSPAHFDQLPECGYFSLEL